MQQSTPRQPEQMPSIVRDSLGLSLIASVVTGILAITMPIVMSSQPNEDADPTVVGIALGGFYAVLCAAFIILHRNLKKRLESAWTFQIVLAAACLIMCFPLGTLIYGILLLSWFKPATRSWLNVRS